MDKGIIERGKITTITDGGYSVSSLDRDGIVTPPLKAIQYGQSSGTLPNYKVGDRVYFFVFSDGTGRIIDKM